MKIALVSPYDFAYPGGVTTHITQLSHEFRRRGHTVLILAPSSKPAAALGIDNLAPLGRPVPIPTAGSIARVSLWPWATPRVRALLARERFDLIHVHEPFMPLPLQVLSKSQSFNVATFHAFRDWSPVYPWAKALLAQSARRVHGRIAVSEPARDYISRYFPGEYHVIPNGIDLAHFASPVAPVAEFLDGKLNILFVGRLEKRKGLKYLLRAFGRLKWDHPDLRLLVVGPGTPDKDSYRIIAERNLQDVVFVGAVPYSELPRFYHTAQIFCAPATGKESQGLVLLEAMAAGKPIVASAIEGYASVLRDGVQGLLVPPKDDLALAQALGRLVDNPALRATLGAQGRELVQEYGRERVATRVLELYEAVMRRAGAISAVPVAAGR